MVLRVFQLVQHKIQSTSGLRLDLDQVPKLLGKLKSEWAPRSFVVSFKLETDEEILYKKAKRAIEKYRVDLVVANMLHTRAERCFAIAWRPIVLVGGAKSAAKAVTLGAMTVPLQRQDMGDGGSVVLIERPAERTLIEPSLVAHLVEQHAAFIGTAESSASGGDASATAGAEAGAASVAELAARYVELVTTKRDQPIEESEESRDAAAPASSGVLTGGFEINSYLSALTRNAGGQMLVYFSAGAVVCGLLLGYCVGRVTSRSSRS